jgi:hypothetical protein
MGIKRSEAPNASSYLDDEDIVAPTKAREDDVFEDEDEDEVPARSSVIQVGWAAAKKAASAASTTFATDFRFEEEVKLVKFLTSDPMAFSQHWVNRTGKRSFICNGTPKCPLCRRGNRPESKFAFSVVDLSADEPQVQLMTVGLRLYGQLEKLNSDPKTGPLDRLFWAASKSGSGQKTSYSFNSVKERDLAEDWDIDAEAVASLLKTLKPLGADALRIPTDDELRDIAREISDED